MSDQLPRESAAGRSFATWHEESARCSGCGHATVGLDRPYAINHPPGCSPNVTGQERPTRDILWLIYHRHGGEGPDTVVTTLAVGREEAKRKARPVLGGNADRYVVTPLTKPGTEVRAA